MDIYYILYYRGVTDLSNLFEENLSFDYIIGSDLVYVCIINLILNITTQINLLILIFFKYRMKM